MSATQRMSSFFYLGNSIGFCTRTFDIGYFLIAQEMFHGLRTNKSCQSKFMAIKTDMNKAYDRVEWTFIQALVQKMGYDSQWIKLMMECISSVQYKFLLKGHPRGLICP